MTLREARCKFTRMLAELILFASEHGYEVAVDGYGKKHMTNSLHYKNLAEDLQLYKAGEWLSKTEDHTFLGEKWESMGGAWGGRFNDGNHYSLSWGGVK